MKMSIYFCLLAFFFVACSHTTPKRDVASFSAFKYLKRADKLAWDQINNPQNILASSEMIKKYSELKKEGAVNPAPWADTYWPTQQGGIAFRWLINETPFRYQTLDESSVRLLSFAQKKNLSPAEKFDIFMGRYDFPTVAAERKRTSPNAQSWEGMCHGWAPASLFFKEPHSVVLTNADGVSIPFGASDIKALLIYYVASSPEKVDSYYVGGRCYGSNSDGCQDPNAGAFHVLIINMVNKGKPLVLDIDRGSEVWNQPVAGYKMTSESVDNEISSTAAPGTVKQIRIAMDLYYGKEAAPQWASDSLVIKTKSYAYTVELDKDDNILGGEWLSSDHPDFLWSQQVPRFSHEYYGKIQDVYKKSLEEFKPILELDGIKVGDLVLETYEHNSLVTVSKIRENGDFFLTGGDEGVAGDWYSQKYIHAFVDELDGFKIGETVLKTSGSTLGRIERLAQGSLALITDTNGKSLWVSTNDIQHQVSKYGEISIGDEVVAFASSAYVGKVSYIGEKGLVFLKTENSDKLVIFSAPSVKHFIKEYQGIKENDEVFLKERQSFNSVLKIAEGGYFLIEKSWYEGAEIERVVDIFQNIKKGDRVVDLIDHKSLVVVEKMTESGRLLVSGGDYPSGATLAAGAYDVPLFEYEGTKVGDEVYVYKGKILVINTGREVKKAAAFLNDGTLITEDGTNYDLKRWKSKKS